MPVELMGLLEGTSIMAIMFILGIALGFWMGLLSRWSIKITSELWRLIFPSKYQNAQQEEGK